MTSARFVASRTCRRAAVAGPIPVKPLPLDFERAGNHREGHHLRIDALRCEPANHRLAEHRPLSAPTRPDDHEPRPPP